MGNVGYWVFDGTASQVLAYSLAVAGMVMFAGGPMLVYGSFPALLPGPASPPCFPGPASPALLPRPCFQRGVAVSPPKMSVMNRVPDDGRNISVMWHLVEGRPGGLFPRPTIPGTNHRIGIEGEFYP